ncbi:hypothetical protein [Pseudomonas gingeri]|uniref:hypothetical protein n=1 Tax=Pseudomonas gingeri TaxID=117681 RepID=UPI0015A0B853|nr:hypothetical protein [Pseudomonas gingeri]NWA11986.1 hypothetical protein [Pseudomonas gingeri]
MQNNPKPKTVSGANKHDSDVLLASNVSSFKQWLLTQGYKVAEPEPKHRQTGILFWVDLPGCKPVSVQEGRGRNARFAMTHCRLRPILKSYLTSPMSNTIREVVRQKAPGPLLAVVDRQVQPPPATNNRSFDILPPANTYLLSAEEIERALSTDATIMAPPGGSSFELPPVQHVFGVRVAGDEVRGLTVAAHMHVYAGDGCRAVHIAGYPIHTADTDLKSLAQKLFLEASALPNATILVDARGLGAAFLTHLQAFTSPTVKRYGMMMGQPLPKRGDTARYFNRRAECSVLAARAIKDGTLKLARPTTGDAASHLNLLGAKLPYSFDDCARWHVPKPDRLERDLPSADLFEAICLAFHSQPLPLYVEKQAPPATEVQAAPVEPLSSFLIDLRDDFAISCPLTMNENETMAAFANRRWEYAQAMVKARPAQSGD